MVLQDEDDDRSTSVTNLVECLADGDLRRI